MKTSHTTCLIVMALSLLPGCKSVTSDHLIGEPIAEDELKLCEGTWNFNDGALHVNRVHETNLRIAEVGWDDQKQQFKLNQMEVAVTELKVDDETRRFLQMVNENKDEDNGEHEAEDASADTEETQADEKSGPWLIVGMITALDDDTLVLYPVRFTRFEQAIHNGELQGEVDDEGSNLHIQADKAAQDTFFAQLAVSEFFNIDDPGVITRISDKD